MGYGGRVGTAFAAILAAVSLSSPAGARPPSWTDRRLVLEGMAGFGTPVGLVGAALRVEPIPWLSVGGGAGVSLGGAEYAGMLLGRIPLRADPDWLSALTLGGSYSIGGSYHHNPNPSCWVEDCRDRWVDSAYELANPHWLGVELGAELRARSGLSLRGFAGLAKLTNPGDVTCQNYDRASNDWLPGPCKAPLSDAPSSRDILVDISGPPGTPDVIWVLGLAVGYAIDITP
jgi:hypothetical protein